MKKRLLSLILVVALVASMCTTAFAGKLPNDEVTSVKYVSLGDSMTNGYGLPGYDGDTGCEDYGYGSYANQFAEWLGAEHTQLGMSAMRAEDLHWLLEFDYNDAEAVAVTEMSEWDEARWEAAFTTGDYWTWNEFCDDYRFAAAAYAIQNDGAIGKIRDREAVIVAEYAQNAVKEADVISLGMGNGNFGVFMFGRILEAIGFSGTPNHTMRYQVENAIRECEPEMQTKILKLKDELYAAAEAYLGISINDGDDENTTAMEALANTVVYTGISYVLNYVGSVEAILQLNPDVELILVELMNTYASENPSDEASIGDLLDAIFKPLNVFIAGLPAYMQVTLNGAYADASFYYAEVDDIECLVDVFEEQLRDEESVIGKRFVESIVGTDSAPGMVWGLLAGAPLVPGVTVTSVTLDEIIDYEELSLAEKAAYAAADAQKAVSIAVYLAFENAIVESTRNDTAVSLTSVLELGGLSMELFEPVMDDFFANVGTDGAAYLNTVAAVVANIAEANFGVKLPVDVIVLAATAGEQAAAEAMVKAAMQADENVMALLSANGLTLDQFLAYGAAGALPAEFAPYYQEYLNNVAYAKDLMTTYGIVSNVNLLCMLLAMPDTLSEALQSDASISGLLSLFARCIIGNGVGSHPSQTGHDQLFEAVKDAYETEYTVLDQTIAKIEQYLKVLGIEIEGDIKEKINEIKAMIEGKIEASVAEIEKAIDELIDLIELRLYHAAHGQYVITDDSYYVAIDELYGKGEGYADKLAAELGIAYTEINELDADEIAKADLITVRYNNEPMIDYMIDQIMKAMADKALDDYDWSVYVGENGAAYVQQAMTSVEAMLAENGMGDLSELAAVAVESYAYEYVGHLIGYIQELKTITTINPEALVISVGMNNALAEVVLTLDEEELALGEYIQYVVDAANLEAFAYALVTGDTIYVDAAEVKTNFTLTNANLMGFITSVTMFPEDLKATDEGHAYIKEQICNALTVTVYDPSEENPPEENAAMLGDADLDGDVDARDAALAYGIFNAKVNNATDQQLKNADVDGDGDVDARDAALIYAYFNGKMAAFPAE